ncbi:amino acid dehydrogenase [Endozoicomonas sp. (ex Bugula neritina AB1)]|nr:amino acid dehydrogenase [Endozoicomonas sp. (ex Bugula neritina AB1)]
MFRKMTEARINDLHFKFDEATGLRSIVAIHNTRRGPALGGCRIIPYSSDDDALTDAVRLARGMSYKAALAGLNLGGGKAVIMEPEGSYDRIALFKAFGSFIKELGGRYITAMDSGSTVEDMDAIASQTQHVTCTSNCGSPAPLTAEGVFYGIQATLKAHNDLPNTLKGVRVAIQGLGNVGYSLCQLLHKEGAQLLVADIDEIRVTRCVQEFGAIAVPTSEIHAVPCELFSPCGLGGGLNKETIPQLKCAAVAGSANNQLLTEVDGISLHQRNILYAPDYVINSGGLVFVAMNHYGSSHAKMKRQILNIHDTLLDIFRLQQQKNLSSNVIANQLAESILFNNQTDSTTKPVQQQGESLCL